ncbi:MAG: N-acetyltransferase [Proteobacteria bacterium]|nr:N-acetyltransferase [Pseudomonadota bacterium]
MSTRQLNLSVEFLTSLGDIPAAQWNQLAGTDYPFMRHEFLWGLEETGCVNAKTGWQPCHAIIRDGRNDELLGLLPLYLKSHSYGEYVFDWSWAEAWQRNGLTYYPKLLTAIPFTPATGPRLCLAPGYHKKDLWPPLLKAIREFAESRHISSWHLLFPQPDEAELLEKEGLHMRTATQFHWFNQGFGCFDDFLATFSSRKRKNLRRERKRVAEQGFVLHTLCGSEISAQHWQQFYRFYQHTYAKRSGHGGYLNREFFTRTAASMGDQVVMVLAYLHDEAVAGALFFRSHDTLYGRYWGCEQEYDCLHFEACYYQGIEYCIANGLKRFDPGAQGEHKIQRGFRPVKTCSNHWISDPRLSDAIADFTRQEQAHTKEYIQQTTAMLPFRADDP